MSARSGGPAVVVTGMLGKQCFAQHARVQFWGFAVLAEPTHRRCAGRCPQLTGTRFVRFDPGRNRELALASRMDP